MDVKKLLLTQGSVSLVRKRAVSLLHKTNTGGKSEKWNVTSWGRVFLEKLRVTQLVEKYLTFYGLESFAVL
jgi:hypothetical protein